MTRSQKGRRLLSMVLGAVLTGAFLTGAFLTAATGPAQAADKDVQFTVDGQHLDTNPADAWKGFGAVTANNTSRELLDYEDEHPAQYWQIMNDLFNPVTGMGLTQVKIELGSDGNTSSGTEPATKRSPDEVANVLRGEGFHFAADAKSINPSVEVSLLHWSDPAWVKTSEDRYQWYKQTVDAAYDTYGLVVDWISPNTNETAANVPFITYVAQRLQQDTTAGDTRYDYSKIKIATSDELDTNNMAKDMLTLIDPATLSQSQKDAARAPDPDQTRAKTAATDAANAGVLWKVSYPQYGSTTYYYRVANQQYMSLISALTHHYTSATSPQMAILNRTYGMEIWYSEGVSGIGQGMAIQNEGLQNTGQTALDVADLFINSYHNAGNATNSGGYPTTVPDAHHSLYMYQPAVAAFPQGTAYSAKDSIDAFDPWSGATAHDLTYFMTKQFTNFARTGTKTGTNQAAQVGQLDNSGAWQYVEAGASVGDGTQSGHSIVNAAASHLTVAAPDRSDFSIVLNNHSDNTEHYTITVANMSVAQKSRLAVYRTQVANGAAFDSNWFQRLDNIDIGDKNVDGSFTFTYTVAPQSINTITTLDDTQLPAAHTVGDGVFNPADWTVLDGSTPTNDVMYSDNFEYADYPARQVAWDYSTFRPGNTDTTKTGTEHTGPALSYPQRRGNTPRYSNDMNGAFEVNDDGTGNHTLVQQLDYNQIPGCWTCGGPETLIGDDRWANYTVSADLRFDAATAPNSSSPNYIGLGGRANQEGNGYLFLLRPDGAWGVVQDAGSASSIAPAMTDTNTLTHGVLSNFNPGGAHQLAVTMRDDTVVASVDGHTVTTWTDPDGNNTRLSGRVHIVSGWYHNSLDNLTISRVAGYAPALTEYVDDGDARVRYSGSVSHYMASASALDRSGTTLNQGGGFQLGFSGTGVLLETDTASGSLDVTVDGTQVASGKAVSASRTRNVAYELTGLADGPHTIQVTSDTGGFKLDSVGILGAIAPGGGTTRLRETIDQYAHENLVASDYSADSWSSYQRALAAAQAIVAAAGPPQNAIDNALTALETAHDGLVRADTPVAVLTVLPTLTTAVGKAPDYGVLTAIKTVEVRLADGTSAEKAVSWANLPDATAYTTPFATVAIRAAVTGTALFAATTVTVLPTDLVYVVDSGRAGLSSDVFNTAKAAQPGIVNEVPDQKYQDGLDWGYTSEDTTAGGVTPGDGSDWASSYVGDSNDTDGLIYNLTLDPGSYALTAVHSTLRALNAESWVTVNGQKVDDRTYPVSTTSPTTVTHTFTLTQRSVVSFQAARVGSSGYNVRIALMYVRSIPQPLGIVGAIQVKPATLPATILQGGTHTAVTWDSSVTTANFATANTVVPVSGVITATGKRFTGSLQVVPADLLYFFDSGVDVGNQPVFDAVKDAVPTLRNTASDQESDGSTWGHSPTGVNVKAGTDAQDFFDTGLWANNGTNIVYYVPLPAGTYTFAAGAKEWYGQTRDMVGVVSDGTTTVRTSALDLSATDTLATASAQLSLAKDAVVTFTIAQSDGTQAPVVSWVSVTGRPSTPAVISGSSVALTNHFTVSGDEPDLHVNGDFSCDSQVHVAGNVFATGNAYLTNNCTIGGNLRVGGNVVMDATPNVGGDVTASGQIRFQSTANIGGDALAGATFTVTDGVSIAKLQSTGRIGGRIVSGQPVAAPTVDAWTPATYNAGILPGTTPITWQAWMNATARANNAPSWSAGLTSAPGCVMAPWGSSVNGNTVNVAEPTVIDARSTTSGCSSVALQQMTLRLSADLVLYANGIESINGLHVVSADGQPHNVRLIVPGNQVACTGAGDIDLSSSTVVDPLITTELRTPGRATFQTGSQVSGQVIAGCVSSSGSVEIKSAH